MVIDLAVQTSKPPEQIADSLKAAIKETGLSNAEVGNIQTQEGMFCLFVCVDV